MSYKYKPRHKPNCPICGQKLETVEEQVTAGLQGPCQEFLCYNPLVNDPLHYYSHKVWRSGRKRIAYQEFEVNMGNRPIIFVNNFENQTSSVKIDKDKKPLEIPLILRPDFPTLEGLKSKIRMALVFT